MATTTPRRRRKLKDLPGGPVVEIAVIVVVALAVALLVQAFLVKPYRIPSGSMEPTLDIGQRVLVNRVEGRFGHPSIGDVTVFKPPKGANESPARCGAPGQGDGTQTPCSRPTAGKSTQTFIKRVVALGGDRISIVDGHVIRNGRRQDEPFINPCNGAPGCDFRGTITVPKGYVFLMGDNRGASDDSRFWGPVPEDWIIGEAFATYWPPKRIGTL
jgi:signal peptidase I